MMGQFMRPLDARHSERKPSTPNRPRPRSTRLAGQGLRTTFPWVFWGFHGKYKIFI